MMSVLRRLHFLTPVFTLAFQLLFCVVSGHALSSQLSSKPSQETEASEDAPTSFKDEMEPFKKNQPLSSWLTQLIETKHYKVLRPSSNLSKGAENISYKNILSLAPEWVSWLKKNHVRVSSSQNWQSFAMPEHLALPKGRPTHEMANSHVFIYTDSVKRQSFYFFKADTTSSCNSGCSPIVFSIVLSSSSSDLDLIPDPSMPLKKQGHKDLTTPEILSLQSTLNSLKSLYQPEINSLQHPHELTGSDEQTWAPYKSTVIDGGAYTSYRVYEAALNLVEAIKQHNLKPYVQSPAEQKKINELYAEHSDRIGEFFRVTNSKEALALLKTIEPRLNDEKLPASLRGQLERMSLVLKLYPFWSLENTSAPKLMEVIQETRLATHFPDFYCRVFLDFANRHNTQNVFKGQLKKLPSAPCGSEMAPWYGALTEDPIAQSSINAVKNAALPEVLKSERDILLKLAARAPSGSALGKSARATLYVTHGLQFSGAPQAELDALFSELKQKYLQRIRPGLGPLMSTELPRVEGVSSIPSSEKRVYVFFQNWCSHCKELLSAMQESLGPQEWKRIQLIETKIQSDIPAQAFMLCLELALPENSCNELLGIPQTSKYESLRQTLELQNIPRIIVTDKEGQITDFDLKLSPNNPGLLKRQIQWAIEASGN